VSGPAESAEAKKLIAFLPERMGSEEDPLPEHDGIGIKPISREGTKRLQCAPALEYALLHERSHSRRAQGHHEVHRGAFRDWGSSCQKEYAGRAIGWDDCGGNPRRGRLLVKTRSQTSPSTGVDSPRRLRRDRDHELNGDYPVGRAGGAGRRHRHRPGQHINYLTGHGASSRPRTTAGEYADQDKVNPELGDPLRVMSWTIWAGARRRARSTGASSRAIAQSE